MTTEQWERENQDTLMEYFIDGDPSVRRIQCEYCRKVIYTQTRNRKYCSFQTCGHKMLNLRKSLKKRVEQESIPALAAGSSSYRFGRCQILQQCLSAERLPPAQSECCFYPVKWCFPFWEVPKYRNA